MVRYRVKADGCLIVRDVDGRPITVQLNPIFKINGGVESQAEFYVNIDFFQFWCLEFSGMLYDIRFQLLFEAKLPPLAAVSYILIRDHDSKTDCAQFAKIMVGGIKASEFIFPK